MTERDPWDVSVIEPAEPSYADAEECDAISTEVFNRAWEDPARFPECTRILLNAVAIIAEGVAVDPRQRATQALRRVQRRVLIGEDQAEVDRHV